MDLGEEEDGPVEHIVVMAEDEDLEEVQLDNQSPFSPASPQAVDNALPVLNLYNGSITADKISDLSIMNVYKKWLGCLDGGQLNEETTLEMLREYWLKVVPHVYRLEANQECLSPFGDVVEVADKYLIEPLAYFISGGHCGADGIQQYLSSSDQPPTVCGRVFQVGEATYSCRECGMDPTCVLCADCFKNSAHKNHKYKIATSAGGGYCDCGDLEAWRNHVHCESHKPTFNCDAQNDPALQEGFETRAKVLLPSLLLYSFELTANELERQMPSSFDVEEKEADKSGNGLFCTVLYNDETHTFDLVIQTLTRALTCSKKDAIEFATTIDREGRSIVKVGGFTPCHEAQKIIEKSTAGRGPNTKSLKCLVMKREVVQHQAFALRLLSWIETLCTYSLAIRRVIQNVFYCRGDGLVLCADSSKSSWLIDAILLNDTKLWKAARACWHRLIIAGLLKEYDSKKTFSEVFTREYASIMDDFIRDDHDHSYSVTSLSVQIFTVPSIAHFLVETLDVIYTILRVLLAQCTTRLNILGKLEFERGAVIATTSFKRTNFAILDLKYILTNPPTEWSPLMVKNFTHGIDSFLKFLSYMQDMDSVTRQVGSHMEYEPEWESAFNLHIKLQPVVQLSLEWCGLNKPVFVRALRHCLHDLSKAYESLKAKTIILELANHAATCYVYDIATQPVSVHLPLTRYFAGLYLHLEKFDLHFFSSEFNLLQTEKPVPEMIMEPALRTQVLIAQVNASMWKRNGYALLNQLYFYHNVRCRNDMLDKDIVTLQIAASVIESNEFLLHVINRFGLYQWILTGFDEKALKPEGQEEDFSKYLGTLSEEFLGLLITLLSARYTPGVGQVSRADAIKKEVIQQLCIEPMTHSMLNKSLVENVNLETGLELVIRDVANQKGPTPQRSSVVYELKPEFYNDYDVYHYHYTREEMSKAEESQRARKKAAKEPEIFPPPKLPPFTAMFDLLVNFLQCDVFLHVISLVLIRSLQKSSRLNESLVRKALHLIGHGLNEEVIRNHREMGHFFQFTQHATKWKVFETLDKMLQEPALSHHHSMILWLRKQHNIIKPESMMESHQETLAAQPDEEEEKKRKTELIKEAKQKMMAKMAAAQKKFMLVNKDLFSEETSGDVDEPAECPGDAEMKTVDTVAVGPSQQCPSHLGDEKYICILCQEEQTLAIGGKRFVLACFIQRSTVLSQYREKLVEESTLEYQLYYAARPSKVIESKNNWNTLYLNPSLNSTTVMTTCGHIMHESCWNSHIETVHNKERRRPYRLRHPLSFDVDKAEWLCPMCDSICNAALPMAAHLPKMYPTPTFSWYPNKKNPTPYDSVTPESFEVWVKGMLMVLKNKEATHVNMEISKELSFLHRGSLPEKLKMTHMVSETFPKILEEMDYNTGLHFDRLYPCRQFQEGTPTGKWLNSGFHTKLTAFMTLNYNTALGLEETKEDDFRMLLEMWNCLSYTIISSEAFHRDQKIPFFGEDVPLRRAIGIKYLTRACGVACDRAGYWVDYMRTFSLIFLSTMLQNPASSPSLFMCDAFGLLVSLSFSMPALFIYPNDESKVVKDPVDRTTPIELACQPPSGNKMDHHILRLVYMLHVTQILLCNDFTHCLKPIDQSTSKKAVDAEEKMETEDDPPPNRFCSRKEYIFSIVWKVAKTWIDDSTLSNKMDRVDCDAVWKSVQDSAIPFLRCSAKFYENLTGIAPPPELETVDSSFDALIKYLDLPKELDDLFDSSFTWQIPYKWASHPNVWMILADILPADAIQYPIPNYPGTGNVEFLFLPETITCKYPRNINSLTPLPEDYTELINMVSNFTCKNSKTLDSRTPTMCLICGIILCSQSYCCQREIQPNVVIGSCMYHANFCGGGSGIFLRIRECKLFFTHGQNRGCFYQPPYLDEYGEPDQGLRRGNPLKLSKEKYEAIRKIWIQHAIPEEIARTTEHSVAVAATEWQYL